MQHGSLYPALHRLEKRGWVIPRWEMAPDRNRECSITAHVKGLEAADG
jgi:DNA-binding PadR family transcriptional regulator